MSLSIDDEFLNVIAYQARVAYATQQLAACRDALQRWQAEGACEASDGMCAQDELADYSRQVQRWQDYLGRLGEAPNVVRGYETPLL
jgi:hypothetical protein